MRFKKPFAQRITIAFFLLTLLVSGSFSVAIVVIVHEVEEGLISEELRHYMESLRSGDFDQPFNTKSDIRFYSENSLENPIPDTFVGLRNGFVELINEEGAFHVYTYRGTKGDHYVVVQDQLDFETREKTLFQVVLLCFLLSLVLAWGVGRVVARRVMLPVSRLAKQVEHRDQLHFLAPPLASEYASDEIGHLASVFDSTLTKLRSSLERERLFTSDVSHELRTPLMVISSSCELLDEMALAPAQQHQLKRIEAAQLEIGDLVDTFLMLAREDKNKETVTGSITLRGVADAMVDHYKPLIERKGLVFEYIVDEVDDNRLYHQVFLRTVMSNLLRNALHYTEQGHIRLVLNKHEFRVEDSGRGVAENDQNRIFQPFERGVGVPGEGLGLGLSLVKRICDRSDWVISVTSLIPNGSIFSVKLV